MIRFLVALLAAAAIWPAAFAQSAWPQEPAAVLGIKLGAPLTESQVAICPSRRVMGAQMPRNCVGGWYEDPSQGNLSFRDPPDLGLPYSATVAVHANAVESVRLSTGAMHFDRMLALLVERYGQPSAKASVPLTTLGGASLAPRVWSWSGDTVSIEAVELAGRVDESMVVITHKPTAELKKARAQQRTKDAAGRL